MTLEKNLGDKKYNGDVRVYSFSGPGSCFLSDLDSDNPLVALMFDCGAGFIRNVCVGRGMPCSEESQRIVVYDAKKFNIRFLKWLQKGHCDYKGLPGMDVLRKLYSHFVTRKPYSLKAYTFDSEDVVNDIPLG